MYQVVDLDTSKITAGNNDRTQFNADGLLSLASSMKTSGLRSPITVRQIAKSGSYQIVAGERRFRASQLLGWKSIPAIVENLSDDDASAIMLSENTARADLDPLDEAHAYAKRINEQGWTVERCAEVAGKSIIHIRFRLKLLTLREDVQHLIRHNNLAIGYAQILADAGLDRNRQLIAVSRLRDQKSPTPAWFRSECAELAAEQSQQSLFSDTLELEFVPIDIKPAKPADPPLPGKDCPPLVSGDIQTTLRAHIAYWNEAAQAWDKMGKSFKRQACEAAASALTAVLNTLGE